MGQELAIVGQDGSLVIPDHIKAFNEQHQSNLVPLSERIPSLTYGGSKWKIETGTETIPVQRKNENGDMEAMPTLNVIILGYAKNMSRNYYEGQYDAANPSPPVCWSKDGLAPDEAVPDDQKQAAKCANCEMAVKGSAISGEGVACRRSRTLAVIPTAKIGKLAALKFAIAQTSDYDGRSKESAQQGYFAFSNFIKAMELRGAPSIDNLVVALSFDGSKDYPKVFFKAAKWASPEQIEAVAEYRSSGQIEAILNGTGETITPVARQVTASPSAAAKGAAQAAQKKAAEAAAKTEAAAQKKAAEDKTKAAQKKAAEAKAAAAKPKEETKAERLKRELAEAEAEEAAAGGETEAEETTATASAGAADGDEDFGEGEGEAAPAEPVKPASKPKPAAAAAAAKPKPAPKVTEAAPAADADVPDDVAGILGEWSD